MIPWVQLNLPCLQTVLTTRYQLPTNVFRMPHPLRIFAALFAVFTLSAVADATNEVSIFPDKNLEAAVRQQVFAKRNTNSPLTAADVVNVSTVVANFRGITSLAGLEYCKAIASLELAGNQITNLAPLSGLRQLQLLILASNRVSDLGPLATVPALQYLEVSHNTVKDAAPLASLTNLASLYLGNNRLTSIAALTNLPRLVSLYAESNGVKSIAGLGNLRGLSGVSLSGNQIADVSPLTGLRAPTFVFLERNRIMDLAPLNVWLTNDLAGPRNFAPYVQLYLKGNPLSGKSRKLAAQWVKDGVRVNQ
jgi:internalin A